MYSPHVSTILLRRLNPCLPRTGPKNVRLLGHCRFYGKFDGYGRRLGAWLGEQSVQVARACTRQCEFIAAQRVRRTIQLLNLYTKIWDEIALKEFMKSWRRRIGRNTREFLVSAVGVTMYNWDREIISDDELYSYTNDIERMHKLRDATVVCKKCHLRLVIDVTQPEIKYCTCHGANRASIKNEVEWQPFMENKDMLVWKKEQPDTGGLYAYKVFGTFSDVSAEDFLQVQIDVDYRKEWDETARRLEIIDSDPRSMVDKDRRSDVVYWEISWPLFYSNRDYVYERRWFIDRDRGIIVIVSKVTDHPDAPIRSDTYRVTTYWSYMVITACTKLNEPGIEFGLTYFDDPGVNLPTALSARISENNFPHFLCRMRQAAKDYKERNTKKQEQPVTPQTAMTNNGLTHTDDYSTIAEIVSDTTESLDDRIADVVITINQEKQQAHRVTSEITECRNERKEIDGELEQEEDESDDATTEFEHGKGGGTLEESNREQEHGYLRYLFLTKLFA